MRSTHRSAKEDPMPTPSVKTAAEESHFQDRVVPINAAPTDFNPPRDLPRGFLTFLQPLHEVLTHRQRELVARREHALAEAHEGRLPQFLPPSDATRESWEIELPEWCSDQRNQMTGPADDAELVVKMLNSGAPGVMLDLEDSNANAWENTTRGIENILAALAGTLTYRDRKRGGTVGIAPSKAVIFTRPRGLHLHQGRILEGELIPASLFDVAIVAYQLDFSALKHPPCFYIPKSEGADEALWWRDLFRMIARAKNVPPNEIKCMALVESHPLAYQVEEFAYNLRDHIVGLNLGRWDYMASLIHFNLEDPAWTLPDRNKILHNIPFFQNLRERMTEICHKHGMLAIGGMTALFPSREDAALNERALQVLAEDKKNEAGSLMDGAWTGHPDQNAIALAQFPAPNQARARRSDEIPSELRPVPQVNNSRTLAGTRAAVRTVIRYRSGVLNGRGASLLDGYMEDLATDRIYRLMIAQRIKHSAVATIVDENGAAVAHTEELITRLFDEELARLLGEQKGKTGEPLAASRLQAARRISQEMIHRGEFDPA
jgi:malate synthase